MAKFEHINEQTGAPEDKAHFMAQMAEHLRMAKLYETSIYGKPGLITQVINEAIDEASTLDSKGRDKAWSVIREKYATAVQAMGALRSLNLMAGD